MVSKELTLISLCRHTGLQFAISRICVGEGKTKKVQLRDQSTGVETLRPTCTFFGQSPIRRTGTTHEARKTTAYVGGQVDNFGS
jgi:hypothetical protein